MFGWSDEKDRFISSKEGGTFVDTWFTDGCKAFSIISNLIAPGQTQNSSRQVIKRVLTSSEHGKKEIVYEMGMQPWFFFDFNIENPGHNRRPDESILQYIKRVWNDDYHYRTNDFAFAEFVPCHMKNTNAKLGVCDKTYYFTYAAGIRERNRMKKREMLTEVSQASKRSLGYDIDSFENLKYSDQVETVK